MFDDDFPRPIDQGIILKCSPGRRFVRVRVFEALAEIKAELARHELPQRPDPRRKPA